MKKRWLPQCRCRALHWLVVPLWVACLSTSVQAKPQTSIKFQLDRAEQADKAYRNYWIPYAFSTESTGLNAGLGYVRAGFLQPQATAGVTVFGGDSKALLGGLWNYQLGGSSRWYVNTLFMTARFPELKAYAIPADIPIPHGAVRPGSHESSDEAFIATEGENSWLDFQVDYVFPLGAARDSGWVHYQTRDGLLVGESTRTGSWNPLASGVTVATAHYFTRSQRYESNGLTLDAATRGLELGLLYDNTDFPVNPSKGSSQYLAYTFDPGTHQHDSWDFWELEASQHFAMGSNRWARHQALSLNVWLGYSPSWQTVNTDRGTTVRNNPLFNQGATLGGFFRLRGYDQNRYHDKASAYLAAEFRQTLRWNPLKNVGWLDRFAIDWVQLVYFAEAGRVAPDFDNRLLESPKADVGAGLRVMLSGLVVRVDGAASDEGGFFWLMVSHPY